MLAACGASADAPRAGQPTVDVEPSPPAASPDAGGTTMPIRTAGVPASQVRTYRPTRLELPSGTVVPVDPADVDSAGGLEIPDDPRRAGWWTGGALVDEPFGSVVLAGHLDSRTYGIGALSELLTIGVGEVLVLGDAQGERPYRVTEISQVPKARLSADTQPFRQDISHRLVLITCVGRYDRAAGGYADNLVVIAEPVT